MTINLFTAVALAIAGFALGSREIVLSPRNRTFPCAPLFVRLAMFLLAVTLGGASVLFFSQPERPYAGDAASTIAVMAGVVAFYQTVLTLNLLSQRYSPQVWDRLDRAHAVIRRSERRPARARG